MVEGTRPYSLGRTSSTGYRTRLLALIALCSSLSVGGRSLFAPLLPAIIDDLGVTPSRAGFALSVMIALSAICRYPAGRAADQLSRKTVLAVALGTMTLGFTVLIGTGGYLGFLLGVVVVGIGGGLYLPSAFALISDTFVDSRGTAIGINNAAVSLGGILAAGVALVVLSRTSWRVAFVPVIPMFALLLILMHRWNDEPYVISGVRIGLRDTAVRLVGRPRIRLMVFSAALVMFAQRGAITFVPLFLLAEKGFTASLATLTFAGYFVVGIGATPIAGSVGDRVGYVHSTLAATLVGSAGLALLLLGQGTVPVIAGVLVFAVGITGFWPAMNAYVLTLLPDESVAGDFGALGAVYLGIGSLGPTYVGVVAERASYHHAFAGLAACLVVSAATNVLLSNR